MLDGYFQVYTESDTQPTTSPLGLVIRALGAGYRIVIVRLLNTGDHPEDNILIRFGHCIRIIKSTAPVFIDGRPAPADFDSVKKGLQSVEWILMEGKLDIVIVEEANTAAANGIVSVEKLLKIIDMRPKHMELIFTGRNADRKIMDKADLVTGVSDIKLKANDIS